MVRTFVLPCYVITSMISDYFLVLFNIPGIKSTRESLKMRMVIGGKLDNFNVYLFIVTGKN